MNLDLLFQTPLIWLGFLNPDRRRDASIMDDRPYNSSPLDKFPLSFQNTSTRTPRREIHRAYTTVTSTPWTPKFERTTKFESATPWKPRSQSTTTVFHTTRSRPEQATTWTPIFERSNYVNLSGGLNDRIPPGIGTIPPLIPRKILLGYPDYASLRLSPDGKFLSYLAPFDGVMNVWVTEFNGMRLKPNRRPVTQERKRNVDSYFWAYDNQTIIYLHDTDGDENWSLTTCNVISGKTNDVVATKGQRANILAVSYLTPSKIAIGLNDRDPRFHDPYIVDLETGEKQIIFQNDHFRAIYFDMNLRPRLAEHIMNATADKAYYYPDETLRNWTFYRVVPRTDGSTRPIQFDVSGQKLYWLDSTNRDKAALVEMNFEDKRLKVLYNPEKSDVSDVVFDTITGEPMAVLVEYDKAVLIPIGTAIDQDLKYLTSISNNSQVLMTSSTLDGQKWLVPIFGDNKSPKYYLYDRKRKSASFLFPLRKSLVGYPLAKMHPREIKSRDGLVQLCYLSLPLEFDPGHSGIPNRPLPMVLLVHGGPWSRDSWGFSGLPQLLANRGYGVLQCNFRGSTGFGNQHEHAGDGEWGGKILEDLVDAVQWAVENGIANPGRIAIMGGSFGGYATLTALAFHPKLFACGVDIVGPSNLVSLLNAIPDYWKPEFDTMIAQLGGDPRTPEGRKFLESHSPLFHADKIEKPLLIAQGRNDPRVPIDESSQIVDALKAANRSVSYVIFPEEGHGFSKQENNLLFVGVTELFLQRCLRGRAEPLRMVQGAVMELGEAGDIPELANFPVFSRRRAKEEADKRLSRRIGT